MSLVRFRPEAPTKQSPGRAPPSRQHASVAHLVERHLAKVEVASSSLVTRSNFFGALCCSIWCHSQVVRQSSAKAPLPSSNLGGTSKTKGHPKGCPFVLGFDRRRRSPPFGISMLGVGKAAPAPRFSPAVKTLVRRTRAAGQKAGWVQFCPLAENLKIFRL